MIKFNNVEYSYKKNKEVLKNINLEIKEGECILLLGESGCGKSTIIKMINGLIPHFYKGHMSGEVIVNNLNVKDSKMHEISSVVGSVFQNPKSQFFNTDTSSEIAFPLENAGVERNEIKRRIDDVVEFLDIKKLMDRNIFNLSGGEKQSVAIASVTASNPNIYAFDEPSANLDYKGIENIKKLLLKLKKSNKTIILSEHRIFYLMDLVDRVIYIKDGSVLFDIPKKEFITKNEEEVKSLGIRTIKEPELIKKEIKTNEGILQIKDLYINQYNSKELLLKNINISANIGDVVGIVGNNGCGKSTLMNVLCGLHKFKKGSIIFNNKKLKNKKLTKNCYMVMQDSSYSLFYDTVLEECITINKKIKKEEYINELDKFGLKDNLSSHPMSLSGGQKQRLAVVISKFINKDILIFDEPTSGLDYSNMLKVSSMLKELSKDKIIFLVSHDRELINLCCNKIHNLEK